MFQQIRAVVMDVDGVLTDGSFWWGSNGEEFKRFCYADTTGMALAREAGLKLALVSGESSETGKLIVQRLADKVRITDVFKGCHDKATAVKEFAARHGLALSEVCYIGDDVIDLPAFAIVGLPIAPADAQSRVRARAQHITQNRAGQGAVREVIDAILDARPSASPS